MIPYDPVLTVIANEARVRTPHVFHLVHAMKAGKFHQAAFAQFTGLEERHVERMLEAIEKHGVEIKAKRQTTTRGHRLPDDWTLPEEWRAWAVKERKWEPSVVLEEAANFADYWHGVSGAKGTKLDWQATWRNWVRNSRRATGDYVPIDQRQTAEGWVAYCEAQLQKHKEANYREGIETWTAKLNAARDRVAANVLPFRREA